MSIRQQLEQLLWQHGVENDALLDALDWKVRKIMDDRRYQYTSAQYDRLLEALTSANDAVVKLSQDFTAENERLREALREGADYIDTYHFASKRDRAHSMVARMRAALAKEAGE